MSAHNLDFLLRPKSAAVIGASPRPLSVGNVVLRNMIAAGLTRIYPVNPKYGEVEGLKCYAGVADLPEAPDLAVIITPPPTVPDLMAELGAKGTRAAVILTAGFGEGGAAEGLALRQALFDAARPHLLRFAGPNCFGVMTPSADLNASFARTAPLPGKLAFIAQSGAVVSSMLDWAKPRNIGFSHVVTLGDMQDVDFGDLLAYLADDQETSAILLYIEAVTRPDKFMAAARAAARGKPVIAVKSGRSAASAKAAASHTGALAGSDSVYDAALRRAGILRVRGLEDLFAAAAVLNSCPPIFGNRLGIVTNGGGFGVLAVDELLERGGRLADLMPETLVALDTALPDTWSRANPVDIIGDAPAERYRAAVAATLADSGVDAVLAMHCPTAVVDPADAAAAVMRAAEARPAKPVLAAWLGDVSMGPARRLLAEYKIPTFATTTEAVNGFMHTVSYNELRETLQSAPPSALETSGIGSTSAQSRPAPPASWFPNSKVQEMLAAYAISSPRTALAATAAEAEAVADRMGGSVALKIFSPDIVHKSDVGGVVLNLHTPAAVRAAAEAMAAKAAKLLPQARLEGFIVEEMIHRRHGHELIVGVTTDATFGPVIAFGQGGTAVEVIKDKSLGLPPLNAVLARQMIFETRVGRLLQGYRDVPAANIDAIAEVLVNISRLIVENPDITDLDINPLLASPDGVIALDARIKGDPDRTRLLPLASDKTGDR